MCAYYYNTDYSANTFCIYFVIIRQHIDKPNKKSGFFCRFCLPYGLKRLYQLVGNPPCDLRHDGVSGSPSLCKVGRSQSPAKPEIRRRSLPLNHLMPCSGDSDDAGTRQIDGCRARESGKLRREAVLRARLALAKNIAHWSGISHKLQWGELSKACNDEYAAAVLGDSEITSVKHAPVSHIPALGKRFKHRLEVSAIV